MVMKQYTIVANTSTFTGSYDVCGLPQRCHIHVQNNRAYIDVYLNLLFFFISHQLSVRANDVTQDLPGHCHQQQQQQQHGQCQSRRRQQLPAGRSICPHGIASHPALAIARELLHGPVADLDLRVVDGVRGDQRAEPVQLQPADEDDGGQAGQFVDQRCQKESVR